MLVGMTGLATPRRLCCLGTLGVWGVRLQGSFRGVRSRYSCYVSINTLLDLSADLQILKGGRAVFFLKMNMRSKFEVVKISMLQSV